MFLFYLASLLFLANAKPQEYEEYIKGCDVMTEYLETRNESVLAPMDKRPYGWPIESINVELQRERNAGREYQFVYEEKDSPNFGRAFVNFVNKYNITAGKRYEPSLETGPSVWYPGNFHAVARWIFHTTDPKINYQCPIQFDFKKDLKKYQIDFYCK